MRGIMHGRLWRQLPILLFGRCSAQVVSTLLTSRSLHLELAEASMAEDLKSEAPGAPRRIDCAVRRRALWVRNGDRASLASVGEDSEGRPVAVEESAERLRLH